MIVSKKRQQGAANLLALVKVIVLVVALVVALRLVRQTQEIRKEAVDIGETACDSGECPYPSPDNNTPTPTQITPAPGPCKACYGWKCLDAGYDPCSESLNECNSDADCLEQLTPLPTVTPIPMPTVTPTPIPTANPTSNNFPVYLPTTIRENYPYSIQEGNCVSNENGAFTSKAGCQAVADSAKLNNPLLNPLSAYFPDLSYYDTYDPTVQEFQARYLARQQFYQQQLEVSNTLGNLTLQVLPLAAAVAIQNPEIAYNQRILNLSYRTQTIGVPIVNGVMGLGLATSAGAYAYEQITGEQTPLSQRIQYYSSAAAMYAAYAAPLVQMAVIPGQITGYTEQRIVEEQYQQKLTGYLKNSGVSEQEYLMVRNYVNSGLDMIRRGEFTEAHNYFTGEEAARVANTVGMNLDTDVGRYGIATGISEEDISYVIQKAGLLFNFIPPDSISTNRGNIEISGFYSFTGAEIPENLSRNAALLAAEEWGHALQYMSGPLSGLDNQELDVALWLSNSSVTLTPEFVNRYGRKAVIFP